MIIKYFKMISVNLRDFDIVIISKSIVVLRKRLWKKLRIGNISAPFKKHQAMGFNIS